MPFVDVYDAVESECELHVQAVEPQPGAEGCGGHLQLCVKVDDFVYPVAVMITLTPAESLSLEHKLRTARQEARRMEDQIDER